MTHPNMLEAVFNWAHRPGSALQLLGLVVAAAAAVGWVVGALAPRDLAAVGSAAAVSWGVGRRLAASHRGGEVRGPR